MSGNFILGCGGTVEREADLADSGPSDAQTGDPADAFPLPPDTGRPDTLTTTVESCATGEAELPRLLPCDPHSEPSSVNVPRGCAPSVDGALHRSEWNDAACFRAYDAKGAVGQSDVVRMKYAGDSLYLATSGDPTCGCPVAFMFDPDGAARASGDEFVVSVLDDPSGADGGRFDRLLRDGLLVAGDAPTGIEVRCPGGAPKPVRFEWRVPLAALGITPGTSHDWRFAIAHPAGGSGSAATLKFPSGLVLSGGIASDTGSWAIMSSSTNWK